VFCTGFGADASASTSLPCLAYINAKCAFMYAHYISYDRSVRPSVWPSVTVRYHAKTTSVPITAHT